MVALQRESNVLNRTPKGRGRTLAWQLAREKQLALTRQIDYKSTLTTNLWTPLIDCVRATNQTTRICDKIAVGSPQRFYRVAFTNCTPAP